MDRVIAGTAAYRSGKLVARAEQVNIVRTAAAVDLDGLDVAERNYPAGTCNDIICNDKYVAYRRTDNYQCIDARPAVDLYRAVLKVAITVVSLAAEELGQVGYLLRIVHVLSEDKERLEQKSVVAASAVQVKLCTVVVDLEPVVLVLAHYKHHVGVSVGQVFSIYYGHALRILERAVSCVRLERHCSDNHFVIAGTEVYYRN